MKQTKTPEAVIRRLPKYYRYLQDLDKRGIQRVSSSKMSADLGFNASQIRRDLNCFGGFGQQGYGYSVGKLKSEIKRILGLNKKYKVIIVGAGNIGGALMGYTHFAEHGFNMLAIFDVNMDVVGSEIYGKKVMHVDELEQFVRNNKIDIGVICTPKSVAQSTADLLVSCGARAIWNYAPEDVKVPAQVSIENVHLSDSLYVLSYRLNEETKQL